jgi:predicted metal-dependent peptidase
MSSNVSREVFDITIANMFSNSDYSNYIFYAHILAQCKIQFDENMPAPAGVSFNINHYTLWINPKQFDTYPLKQRLGILKHEMLHILNNHVSRSESRIHLAWNVATDIAINQLIEKGHVPEEGCFYDTFKLPANLSAEQYYDLLEKEAEKSKCESCNGSGHSDEDCEHCNGTGKEQGDDGSEQECEHCNGTGKKVCEDCSGTGTNYKPSGDHGKWQESEGDEDLKKDITKSMIEKSISKSRGNVPHNISEMLQLFTRKAQVSWKKVLRNITSNKKANTRRTIMKTDRRFTSREDLKGKTKDRTFDLVVILDVSGSMSNSEVQTGLSEIHEICRMSNSSLKLIQVDTEVHGCIDFKKSTKTLTRLAQGGTHIYPAVQYMLEKKIPHDAVVIITDGGIESVDKWDKALKCRTIFLTTQEDIPGIKKTKYTQFNLVNQK